MTPPSSTDTIAAVATAAGVAGIAIVRISGPESLGIADAVFRGSTRPSEQPGGTFLHGRVRPAGAAPGGADLDEVILLVYRAPQSYTREDVVEIQGHGGRACAGRILRAALESGARAAEPGEFTRRAFLNGRIDLLQAEAVADLIQARSERAASAALEQLEGGLSSSIGNTYDALLNIAATLEATLDFPEDELPPLTVPDLLKGVEAGARELEQMIGTWGEGHLLREGALVAICGRPNVGKSSLLNRWLGSDRAIVTKTPGTTRDTIEEQVILDGIPLRLVDTAGLRRAECHIERQGVERAQAVMGRADVVIYLVDASQPLCVEDRHAIDALSPTTSVLVLNKTDLGVRIDPKTLPFPAAASCSLLQGEGLAEIAAGVTAVLAPASADTPHAAISERHRQYIQNALNALNECAALLRENGEDHAVLAATEIRTALELLGELTGRSYTPELLNSIFSRFCIGK